MSLASRRRPSGLLLLLSVIGAATFLYPLLLPALAGVGARPARGGVETSLLFTGLGATCLVLMLLVLQERTLGAAVHDATQAGHHAATALAGGGRTKVIALLGMLVAVDAALRLAPTLLGASPIFLLIILVGFAYGAEIGFLMGALTLLVSALITGGLGPWLPYQMLGAGWMGMTAGWLPRWGESGGRRELLLLAVFGAVWGLGYGVILNLMEWPFSAPGLSARTGIYWTPDMGLVETVTTYGRYYLVTSLSYDLFRSVANVLLILALGRPILRLLDRYRTRFLWQPWQPLPVSDDGERDAAPPTTRTPPTLRPAPASPPSAT